MLKRDNHATYILLGIENQQHVHYGMPVRNMLYDALSYSKQIDELSRKHIEDKDYGAGAADFLSGIHKGDRLRPVVTLVMYWTPEAWDGPMSIYQMLEDCDAKLLEVIPDYRINLLTPHGISDADFGKFRTKLGAALQFIKASKDKDKLNSALESNPEFQHFDRQTVGLINAVTNSRIQVKDGEEEINVCTAINDMKKESFDAGKMDTLIALVKRGLLSVQNASETAGISTMEFQKLLNDKK